MVASFQLRRCENWKFNRADKRETKRLKFYGRVSGNNLLNEISRLVRTREKRHAYRASVGKPGGKRQPGRTRPTWEENIKMDLKKIGWVSVDWISLRSGSCGTYGGTQTF